MPIQILPARLANQIAAGEVVERPASVVKELVENSLDAGATQIDIDIEKGGHKRICIRDNGCGIDKQELSLALSRHATSKIASLDDLEAIQSLGFRGEALASISAVSRLSLTSRPASQQQAWQASCEGRDMQVNIKPAAHPKGTSIDVLDLFFNTPGRRKFLRTEKTEFGHIEDVIRRIALSRFDVSFQLTHNGKLMRKYPALSDDVGRLRRVQAICGKNFADAAIGIDCDHDTMRLHGWIAQPEHARNQNDLQYCFVNGRMMRDKLINHAVRQAYEGLIAQESYPAFVLYIDVPAEQVDVNVHPAKHEVRFHQARLVHDFIYRVLADALQQHMSAQPVSDALSDKTFYSEPAPVNHDYITPLRRESDVNHSPSSRSLQTETHQRAAAPSQQATQRYYELMSVREESTPCSRFAAADWMRISDESVLIRLDTELFEVPVTACTEQMVKQRLTQQSTPQPLLLPVSIQTSDISTDTMQVIQQQLGALGFDLNNVAGHLLLRAVPAGLRSLPWSAILPEVLTLLATQKLDVDGAIAGAMQKTVASFAEDAIDWFSQLDTDSVVDLCYTHGQRVVLTTNPQQNNEGRG
ncbi:DNA mismatch repair endonuclease MutL [Aestuariibacter salexigens]|uniref:DNA mismatch repair endonuclease MutL n=1 Tax=Aestuariibacter salexigens TaxID=226010 RepID=UPI000405E755|nr:DNA mismatch repair endonuclease MutL [Aestuariibacter salexigens]